MKLPIMHVSPAYSYFSIPDSYAGYRQSFRKIPRKKRASPLCVLFYGLCKEPITLFKGIYEEVSIGSLFLKSRNCC
jgi:hypothetical protein